MVGSHLRTLFAAAGLALATASCSSATTSMPPATSAATGSVDCSVVSASEAKITAAQATMVNNGSTTPQQVSVAANQIAESTRTLGELSRAALPAETALWVATTDAYANQIAGGVKTNTGVSELLMEAHAFNSAGYRHASKAIGDYFTAACPG